MCPCIMPLAQKDDDSSMIDFTTIRAVIMDMDGVLWRGTQVLPGAPALFSFLRARGLPFALATNNSSRAPSDYVEKLAALAIGAVEPEQIITSGTAAARYLRSRFSPGTPVHVLGGDGLRALIQSAGFTLVGMEGEAAVVVVGIDFDLTYAKLKRAALLIRAGAEFIGTNADATFPLPDGLAPGAGSLLAALRTATGREPRIMGKPAAPMFEAALEVVAVPPASTLMIGDRLDTDIAGASALGLRTALVLTGVAAATDLKADVALPDAVYADLPTLLHDWEAACGG